MTAFTGEVHPLADVFPMLDDESLQALADDIKANGLRERIVIDKQGRLVDGRNRLAACRLAGVMPQYVTLPGLEGDGAAAFIVSANLQRRDLTQGQKAHLAVQLLGSQIVNTEAAAVAGVPHQRIAEARTVAEFAPHLAAEVIAKTLPHKTAYETAVAEKRRREQAEARRSELEQHAPELLANLGDDFTLDMAYAAYQERDKARLRQEAEQAEARRGVRMSIWGAVNNLAGLIHEAQQQLASGIGDEDVRLPSPITAETIANAERGLAWLKGQLA